MILIVPRTLFSSLNHETIASCNLLLILETNGSYYVYKNRYSRFSDLSKISMLEARYLISDHIEYQNSYTNTLDNNT